METLGRLLFPVRGWLGVPLLLPALVWARYDGFWVSYGLWFIAMGLALRFWAVRYSGKSTRSREIEARKLATSGPYSIVRHPIYIANILTGAGFILAANALLPALLAVYLVGALIAYSAMAAAEERYLEGRFGRQYHDYIRKTPRFIVKRLAWSKGADLLSAGETFRNERSTHIVALLVILALVLRFALREVAGI